MHKTRPDISLRLSSLAVLAVLAFPAIQAQADAVTDWNEITIKATKGYNGVNGIGAALNSNIATRIEAIEARAVFDAVNSINHFSPGSYYYHASNAGTAAAAAAQAAHDVILDQIPATALWQPTRDWVEGRLAAYLAALGVELADGGIQAGKEAAAAALLARKFDNSAPVTTYGADLGPTTNPGIGLWRQSNGGAGVANAALNIPTGFDAGGNPVAQPGINLNWRDVEPFGLSHAQKIKLVAGVPPAPEVGSPEYEHELAYVEKYGRDTSAFRTADQTAQAVYYKLDAELFVNEAARIASQARGLSLDQNARLFALLDTAVADARFAAFDSKYQQKFWRPVTALNADAEGAVTNNYSAWHPLGTTPAHPSNTSGHSATGAAGFEVLRSVFGDKIRPDGSPVSLGTLDWLTGTNNGTGVNTSRSVNTFSQAQLENGASRIYLGVHYGYDNVQGQLLGLKVADAIIESDDPAAAGLKVDGKAPASLRKLTKTLAQAPSLYGYFGLPTRLGREAGEDEQHH